MADPIADMDLMALRRIVERGVRRQAVLDRSPDDILIRLNGVTSLDCGEVGRVRWNTEDNEYGYYRLYIVEDCDGEEVDRICDFQFGEKEDDAIDACFGSITRSVLGLFLSEEQLEEAMAAPGKPRGVQLLDPCPESLEKIKGLEAVYTIGSPLSVSILGDEPILRKIETCALWLTLAPDGAGRWVTLEEGSCPMEDIGGPIFLTEEAARKWAMTIPKGEAE